MAYGYYYLPVSGCSFCPYMMIRGNSDQSTDLIDEKLKDLENIYDRSQQRILPLLTIPLIFAALGPRPSWGPPPFYYNYYWYYYR